MDAKEFMSKFYEKTWLNKLEDSKKEYKPISNNMFLRLSKNDIKCLNYVQERENITLTDIAKTLRITKPSVTAMVYRLKKIGLVEKTQSKNDKRVYLVTLTKKAEEFLNYDKNKFLKLGEIIKKNLNTEEISELMRIFKKAQMI